MDAPTIQLLKAALKLSPEARAELAVELLNSLDAQVDTDAREQWSDEIKRRLHQIDSGEVKAIPWSEVRASISAK